MADEVLAKAQRDVERLQARQQGLQDELDRVREELRDVQAFIDLYHRYSRVETQPEPGQLPLANIAAMTIADATEAILRARRAPTKMTDIISALRRGGKIRGDSRAAYGTVFKALKNHPERFEKTSTPGVWKLKDRESPAQVNGRTELSEHTRQVPAMIRDDGGQLERN